MRRLVGFIAMALVVTAAGMASAHDGTKVIYDLAEIGQEVLSGGGAGASESGQGSTPLATPPRSSNGARATDLEIVWTEGDFEVQYTRGRSSGANGSGPTYSPSGSGSVTSNPEPGTLILMGSGLVAGARIVRRRKNR
ncbi:MAG: PEP-CTERM sorting domain-containing protein [Candidatus Krumholzibacteriia bacterium]